MSSSEDISISSASESDYAAPSRVISWQELLLEGVRERHGLYTKADSRYHNRDYKDSMWEEISQILIRAGHLTVTRDKEKMTADLAKKKWTSMRDTLRKNVKARNEKSASGHSSLKKQGWKKYKYYDIMKWYLHANKKRRSRDNRGQPESTQPRPETNLQPLRDTTESTTELHSEKKTDSPIASPLTSASASTSEVITSKLKKSATKKPVKRSAATAPTDMSGLVDGIEKSTKMLAAAFEADKGDILESDTHYSKYIAAELAQIPDGYDKDRLKLKIQQMIIEVKYGQSTSKKKSTPNKYRSPAKRYRSDTIDTTASKTLTDLDFGVLAVRMAVRMAVPLVWSLFYLNRYLMVSQQTLNT